MDQPKSLSAIEKVEKLLGLEWSVSPTPRDLFKKKGDPTKYRQNHVTVIDPAGKKFGVSRHKSKNYPGGYAYLCDDGDCECEHVKKAQAYWIKLDQPT